jgi:molecular chaperone DnaK (HSP70)
MFIKLFFTGGVTIITNQSGNRTTPSIVAFTESDRLVGEAAKNQAIRFILFLCLLYSVKKRSCWGFKLKKLNSTITTF